MRENGSITAQLQSNWQFFHIHRVFVVYYEFYYRAAWNADAVLR